MKTLAKTLSSIAMNARTLFPLLLCFVASARCVSGQIAPAAVVITEGAPGEHYIFRSQGTFTDGSAFGYVNYSTGEIDSILTSIQSNGTFSGISEATGRSVSGTITSSNVTFTYNGATITAPKSSSYGTTRAFAGVWTGDALDPVVGGGSVTAVVTSQGQVFVSFLQDFSLNEGFGTISASGTFFVPLLDGRTISGVFSPTYGFFLGSFMSFFRHYRSGVAGQSCSLASCEYINSWLYRNW